MKNEREILKDKILLLIKGTKKYPYIFQEQVVEIAEEFFDSDEVFSYIDKLGYIDFEKAILDNLAIMAYIDYSDELRKTNEALEVIFTGRSMNGKYIILELIELDDPFHSQYTILDLAIEDYLLPTTSNEADRFLEAITSTKPVLGSIVRFFYLIYHKDLSESEIYQHQSSFPEDKTRKPIFENLKQYDSNKKYLSSYAKRRAK